MKELQAPSFFALRLGKVAGTLRKAPPARNCSFFPTERNRNAGGKKNPRSAITVPFTSTMRAHWVPFPAPGPPRTKTTAGFMRSSKRGEREEAAAKAWRRRSEAVTRPAVAPERRQNIRQERGRETGMGRIRPRLQSSRRLLRLSGLVMCHQEAKALPGFHPFRRSRWWGGERERPGERPGGGGPVLAVLKAIIVRLPVKAGRWAGVKESVRSLWKSSFDSLDEI